LSDKQFIFKIDPDLSQLFKELSGWDYQQLKEDIRQNGIKIPIMVSEDGTIVDGYQRRRAWMELGRYPFDIPKIVKHYDSREEMIQDAITLNILRRHLNRGQRAYFATKYLLPQEKEKAEERMLAGIKDPSPDLDEGSGRAYELAGKKVGLGKTTLRKAERVFKESNEEKKQNVLKGKLSIDKAYQDLERKDKHENPPRLPEGEFDVIYADPPWSYDYTLRGSPDEHYTTMKTKDIKELEIPCAENAVLFLWATNPKIEDALNVMRGWRFKYKTNMVWVKDKIGTGYYFRGQHELLLIGIKGEIPVPTEATRRSSVLESPRREHSQKPDEVYEIIESMYPNRKYLELFSRTQREGWESWGYETS